MTSSPNPGKPAHPRQRGSVLVICVVLAALGTVGVAGWIALLDARGHQAEATIAATERRAVRENSRALARRALYANHLHANAALPEAQAHALPDGLGSAELADYAEIPLSASSLVRMNKIGATPLRSFTVDAAVTVPDGAEPQSWLYQLRSSHPALDGELLVIHPQVDFSSNQALLSGNLVVRGRATLWDLVASDLPAGFLADEILLPNDINGTSTFRNSEGAAVLPLNYPFRTQTTGFFSAGTPYEGGLEVISHTPNPHNSYVGRISLSGNHTEVEGTERKGKGKGPNNKPNKTNESEIEQIIEDTAPQDLPDELSGYGPLSSNSLKKVLQKDNPPLNGNQLRQILDGQGALPDDTLTDIAAEHEERLALDELATLDWYDNTGARFVNGGSGKAKVFLDRTDLTHLAFRNLRTLVLYGQPNSTRFDAARAMPPLVVVVVNEGGTPLERIECFHRNGRPLILALQSPRAAPSDATVRFRGNQAFPTWRMVLEADNVALRFDPASVSTLNLVGGIRSNRRVHVASGTLTLRRDSEGSVLAPFLARNAWIESYRQ